MAVGWAHLQGTGLGGRGFHFRLWGFFPSVFLSLPHSGKGTDPEKEEEIVLKGQFSLHIGQCSRGWRE